ncbi:MAG: carboxypeptidase-like regulatory domain-containing protein, partial [bacterium]
EPLFNVNVFLANTTRGDATDKDGIYLIENIPPGAYDLVFSMMGYNLEIVQVQFIAPKVVKYNRKLQPRVLKGKEIQVVASEPKEWRKNLQKFIEEFIGSTENAKKCKILNPEVLDFQVVKEKEKFIAATDSTLVIENRSLGYRLHIILDTFRISKDSLIYATYPRYEELIPQDENESKKWMENRHRTYEGSFRHFLSALARGVLEQEDFILFSLNSKHIISDELNIMPDTCQTLKWLFLDHPLEVIYKGISRAGEGKYIHEWGGHFPSSIIIPKKGYALIDTFGNVYTKFALIHSGYWYKERMADMLPFDYISDYQDKN